MPHSPGLEAELPHASLTHRAPARLGLPNLHHFVLSLQPACHTPFDVLTPILVPEFCFWVC